MSKKKRNGRPGKFHEWLTKEGLIKLEGWARDGLTDKQIAHNIGITEQTLNVWKKKYSSLSESLKRGKEVVDRQVENALLKRALGYRFDEITREKVWNEQLNAHEMTVVKIVTKEVNPDTTAQIFWLKNRKPQDWRDRQDINHSGSMDIRQQFEEMSDEELSKMAGMYDVEE